MKTTTLANDIYIQGYGTLPKGLKLNVTRFNSRYIYADLNGCCLKLAYSDTTAKRPKNDFQSLRDRDVYIDYFDNLNDAKLFLNDLVNTK